MAETFPEYGIEFEVLYMAAIEPDRSWTIPLESFKYPYYIFRGIHPTISNFYAHFNPGLLLRLLKNDYDLAVVGGMASPTHWLAPFFIGPNKVQIMSIESNLQSVERKTGLGAWLKRKLLARASAYQITGAPQREYVEYFCPEACRKPFITLPNLIDENVFVTRVDALRKDREDLRKEYGVNSDEQMWILPARLITIKGIIPFIQLLDNIRGTKLFVIGEGELKYSIISLCKAKNIPVSLPGFVQQEEMIRYYAAADLFVLPSLKDPSPLSPIEACAAGLPLLVSSQIGNLEDVVVPGLNGWSYDTLTEQHIGKKLVSQIAGMSRECLREMGSKSRERYMQRFETRHNIEIYAKTILQIMNSSHGETEQ